MRTETVTNDACRKFHADNVHARLITTYIGPGTEYGVPKDACCPPEQVHQAPSGAAMLLKGLKWPTSNERQLKHRSPPIEGTGIIRFVVVLEPDTDDTKLLSESYTSFA